MASDFNCLGDSCNGTGGVDSGVPFWGGTATSSYKLLLAIHILAMVAAFGPTLVFPTLMRVSRQADTALGKRLVELAASITKKSFLPSLIATAVFGLLLSADSSKVYDMSKPWISGAFTVVIALVLVAWFLLRPAQQRLLATFDAEDNEQRKSTVRSSQAVVNASTGLIHLGLVVIIVLMVWKPGQ